jgi:hypothetical protein
MTHNRFPRKQVSTFFQKSLPVSYANAHCRLSLVLLLTNNKVSALKATEFPVQQ